MKTIVNIPYEPAPKDPRWMIKKKAGKRLTADETLEYYQYLFEKDFQDLSKKII